MLTPSSTDRQVDSRDVPHKVEYRIDPDYNVDEQPWYTGAVERPKEFWGAAGAPPLPDDVPEIVKLALGDRVNRPINVEIAMSWVLATGELETETVLATVHVHEHDNEHKHEHEHEHEHEHVQTHAIVATHRQCDVIVCQIRASSSASAG